MTDTTAALTTTDLGEFEGATVLGVAIEIPSAAGGLRDALKIEPVVLHRDEEVLVLLRCDVGKIRFDPIKDTQGVTRVHVLTASEATIVDGQAFEEALEAQAVKIERAKEAAAGIAKLPIGEELVLQHGEGAHAGGLVDGCDVCDSERDTAEAGD